MSCWLTDRHTAYAHHIHQLSECVWDSTEAAINVSVDEFIFRCGLSNSAVLAAQNDSGHFRHRAVHVCATWTNAVRAYNVISCVPYDYCPAVPPPIKLH